MDTEPFARGAYPGHPADAQFFHRGPEFSFAAAHRHLHHGIAEDEADDDRHPPKRRLERRQEEQAGGQSDANRKPYPSPQESRIEDPLRSEKNLAQAAVLGCIHTVDGAFREGAQIVGQVARCLRDAASPHEQEDGHGEQEHDGAVRYVVKGRRLTVEQRRCPRRVGGAERARRCMQDDSPKREYRGGQHEAPPAAPSPCERFRISRPAQVRMGRSKGGSLIARSPMHGDACG